MAIDGKIVFDITGFYGTIEEELARRDFTVNALAVLLRNFHGSDKSVIGCVDDVYNRMLNPVSPDVFTDDGVRILRALRIARQCDMVISHELHRLIIRDKFTLSKSAPERIMKEFMHLLSMPQAMMEMRRLDQYDLLAMIFPELEACRGVSQPKKYHMCDVLWHQLRAVQCAELFSRHSPGYDVMDYGWHFDEVIGDNQTRRTILKLAALLHDIGKPSTRTESNGEVHFYSHEKVGAELVQSRLSALKMSRENITRVTSMVKHHMRTHILAGEPSSRRSIHKFYRDVKGDAIDMLYLGMADKQAQGMTGYSKWRSYVARCKEIMDLRNEPVNQPSAPCSYADGNDVMGWIEIDPGPNVGKFLDALKAAEAARVVIDRESAREYAMALSRTKLKEN